MKKYDDSETRNNIDFPKATARTCSPAAANKGI